MGFVGKMLGGGASAAAATAPVSNYRAEMVGLDDAQRKMYADKIAAIQSGQGPSVANLYVDAARDKSMAQALSMARSARGNISPGAAYRQALNAASEGGQQAVQQGAMMRAQEGMDMTKFYEQLGMQGDMANQSSKNQSQGINAGMAQANLQGQQNYGTTSMKSTADMVGGLFQGLGSAASVKSDEGAKTHVEGFDTKKFLDDLKSYKFDYKNPSVDGDGKQIGVMAQDVEKEAPQMVNNTPQGKMLDVSKSIGPILASLANLNERLEKSEGMMAGGKVPGKASVSGDSPKNDTVLAKLSPGEIVIPRSLADDPERAKKFIESLKKRKKK